MKTYRVWIQDSYSGDWLEFYVPMNDEQRAEIKATLSTLQHDHPYGIVRFNITEFKPRRLSELTDWLTDAGKNLGEHEGIKKRMKENR